LSLELFHTPETRNPNRKIPTDKALEILDDCAEMGVKAIQFTGGGEITVHPDHIKIIQHAQDVGLETSLVTNGVKLDPTSPTILALKWLRISVDAGNATDYARIRQVPEWHFRRVWENVAALVPNYEGVLGIGFVITPDSYKGVVEGAKRAEDSGVDNMRISGVTSMLLRSFYPEEVIPLIHAEIDKALADVKREDFDLIDLFSRRMAEFEQGAPKIAACHYQHFTVYIGGDLGVYRCCNVAYTTRGTAGSLKEQRFRDFIATAADSYYPFDGRGCKLCQFMGQNELIESLVAQPPMHVNFP
jgi:MoaA/NifB/PqqE/SkfB family radical SAM enzyme